MIFAKTGIPSRAVTAVAAFAVAASLGLGGAPAIAQEKTTATIRVASVLPERSAMSVAMVNWGKEITEKTEGRIQFRYFWTGTLLSSADSAEGIRDGRADAGLTGGVFLPARLPLATVGTIPFMTSNVAAMGYAHLNAYQNFPEFREEFKRAGLHVIGFLPGGVNTVFSKAPIEGVEGMKNVKIRTVGLGADAMRAVDANPIAIGANDIYEALGKGLLDASSGLPLDLGIDFSLHKAAPYIIDTKYGVYTMALYAINLELYEKLDPETRKIVDEASAGFMEHHYFPEMIAAEKSRCDKAKAEGAKFVVWDDSQVGIWRERLGNQAIDRWIASVAEHGADGRKFLDVFEADLREMEKAHPWTNSLTACGTSG